MVFFRQTYHTKEFFIVGNDLMVRHVEKIIDFRGKDEESDFCHWFQVKDTDREKLIRLSQNKSNALEKEYQESKQQIQSQKQKK
tara:strand:+ start:29 stop:280 length:252 start_codon:yes stop_codon:yes gene_type:complete